MLRAIGHWIENLQDTDFPAPQELVGFMPTAQRAALANYLQNGKVLETYRGFSWCRFHWGIAPHQMGSSDLTDGHWVWPQGLHHYVTAHNLLLPHDFIQHALSRPTPGEVAPHTKPDFSFWIQWAAGKRSPEVLKKLELARLASERLTKEVHQDRIIALTLSKGISNSPCLRAQCADNALNGSKFCAEHDLSLLNPNNSISSTPEELRSFLNLITRMREDAPNHSAATGTSHTSNLQP